MACFHPLTAWRTPTGEISLSKEEANYIQQLKLPCGGCLGCRTAYAQAWALRCQLELQQHQSAVFTTLTYDDEHLPLTLQKEALPLWLKRLRKNYRAQQIRFFASAEYGEHTQRPHYHALLYGLSMADERMVERTWGLGHTHTEPITPARIAYTAGYCQKKIGYKRYGHERVDPLTGEVYEWEPPFKLMSRRPGIGGDARKWAQSWRLYAVKDGHKMAVPRFLHEAWKAQATIREKEQLHYEKYLLTLNRDNSKEKLRTAEIIAEAKQKQQAEKRRYQK